MTDKEIAKLVACRLKGHVATKTIPPYCNTCFQKYLDDNDAPGKNYTKLKRAFKKEYSK